MDELRRAGTPIPPNDVWIAAIASSLDGYLLNFDHVERVRASGARTCLGRHPKTEFADSTPGREPGATE